MIKTVGISLMIASVLFAADAGNVQEKAKNAMMELGKSLKTELKAKMKEDPSGLKAVTFCADAAQKLTKEVNEKLGGDVTVRRTAIRYRNPDNKPSAQDLEVMQEFQARMAKGESPEKMSKAIPMDDRVVVYKAMGVGKPCLKCHGPVQQINADILKAIDAAYPDDQARDFKQGDFRGAIIAEVLKK